MPFQYISALYEANLPNLKVVIDNSFSDLELTEASIATYHKVTNSHEF